MIPENPKVKEAAEPPISAIVAAGWMNVYSRDNPSDAWVEGKHVEVRR